MVKDPMERIVQQILLFLKILAAPRAGYAEDCIASVLGNVRVPLSPNCA
jgi:hypothetical protein